MEPTAPSNPQNQHRQLYGIGNLVCATVVTIMACIAVLPRWGTYSWLYKGYSLFFLLSLTIMPLSAIARKKGWAERLEAAGASDWSFGYIWVMMLLFLFKALPFSLP